MMVTASINFSFFLCMRIAGGIVFLFINWCTCLRSHMWGLIDIKKKKKLFCNSVMYEKLFCNVRLSIWCCWFFVHCVIFAITFARLYVAFNFGFCSYNIHINVWITIRISKTKNFYKLRMLRIIYIRRRWHSSLALSLAILFILHIKKA